MRIVAGFLQSYVSSEPVNPVVLTANLWNKLVFKKKKIFTAYFES